MPVTFGRHTLQPAMKAIWTFLFAACVVATIGIAFLLVPESARGDRFWLSVTGVILGLLVTYASIALMPQSGGEQGQEVLRFQSTIGSVIYFLVALGLAGVASSGISFNWLAVLHILALLLWMLVVGLGAIGSLAVKRADELNK